MGKKFWITIAGVVVLLGVLLALGFAVPADGCGAGVGDSFETAIVVTEYTEDTGVTWEYDWLTENACPCNGGPAEVEQQDLEWQGDIAYDILHTRCEDGSLRYYYFNINNFFGKW